MDNKQLRLIYEYMGWEVCSGKLYPCLRCNPTHYEMKDYDNPLDSNSAWECVQEMERKGDWRLFYLVNHVKFLQTLNEDRLSAMPEDSSDYFIWLYNPTNFFNCMAKWLEVK